MAVDKWSSLQESFNSIFVSGRFSSHSGGFYFPSADGKKLTFNTSAKQNKCYYAKRCSEWMNETVNEWSYISGADTSRFRAYHVEAASKKSLKYFKSSFRFFQISSIDLDEKHFCGTFLFRCRFWWLMWWCFENIDIKQQNAFCLCVKISVDQWKLDD